MHSHRPTVHSPGGWNSGRPGQRTDRWAGTRPLADRLETAPREGCAPAVIREGCGVDALLEPKRRIRDARRSHAGRRSPGASPQPVHQARAVHRASPHVRTRLACARRTCSRRGGPEGVLRALRARYGVGGALVDELVPDRGRGAPGLGGQPGGGGDGHRLQRRATPASRRRAWSTTTTACRSRASIRATARCRWARRSSGGEPVRLLLEAAANPTVLHGFEPTMLGDVLTAGDQPLYRFGSDLAGGAGRERVASDLRHRGAVGADARARPARSAPARDPARPGVRAGRPRPARRRRHRRRRPRRAGRGARPARPHASAHRLSAAGHAHIDSAWLWPLRETVRKASRTFANVTDLAERVPRAGLRLLAGPAVRLGQGAPAAHLGAHQEGRAQRATGRRSARCGWSRTPTCPAARRWPGRSLTASGSSVRNWAWRPRRSGCPTPSATPPPSPSWPSWPGCDWFLTQKMSWNQTNKMPHHTFWWEGIDGTRVFTHFPPVDTYNAQFHAAELAHAVAQLRREGPGDPLAGAVRLRRRRAAARPAR